MDWPSYSICLFNFHDYRTGLYLDDFGDVIKESGWQTAQHSANASGFSYRGLFMIRSRKSSILE